MVQLGVSGIAAPVIQAAQAQSAPQGGTMKPGYRTTEFWIALGTTAWTMFGGMVPAPWNAVVLATVGGLYSIARGLAKAGVLKGTVGTELATKE